MPKWTGPWRIVDQTGPLTYAIEYDNPWIDRTGNQLQRTTAHVSLLCPYREQRQLLLGTQAWEVPPPIAAAIPPSPAPAGNHAVAAPAQEYVLRAPRVENQPRAPPSSAVDGRAPLPTSADAPRVGATVARNTVPSHPGLERPTHSEIQHRDLAGQTVLPARTPHAGSEEKRVSPSHERTSEPPPEERKGADGAVGRNSSESSPPASHTHKRKGRRDEECARSDSARPTQHHSGKSHGGPRMRSGAQREKRGGAHLNKNREFQRKQAATEHLQTRAGQ